MMFRKVAIVGVGLIGGSIGLAVKRKRLAGEVVGICRRESSRRKALKFKAVDRATNNMRKGVSDADLVIIAAPVGRIPGLAKKAIPCMKDGAILTDVGSSKRSLVRQIEKMAKKRVNFVGSHPMAGSEKSGVPNASASIFDKAALLLTKTKNTDKRSLGLLRRFWKRLGCRVFVLSPEKHDAGVSLVSYVPHAVSSALSNSQTKDSLMFAAGSLKDATRVSSSDPELWKDIFLSAGEDVSEAIEIFIGNLKALKSAIRKRDEKKIRAILARAKKVRDSIR